MTTKRRKLIPMFQTTRDREWAMKVLEQEEAAKARRDADKPPGPLCCWCDQPSELNLGEVAGEGFCAEHFASARQHVALNGGVFTTPTRRQREAFRRGMARRIEIERGSGA